MSYRVRLIRNKDKNIPYEIGGITANDKYEAVKKAKQQIVEHGYWFPWENDIQKRYDSLNVEWVDTDN
jgi:hypothetical protein